MSPNLLILVFIAAYFVGILTVSRIFSRKISNLKDFFLAGQSLGVWPVALTFAASWFGAASTIATLNLIYAEGINGLWALVIPSVLSFVVITLFFARQVARYSRGGALSEPEAVEAAYGPVGRLILSITILGAVSTFIGSQLVAVGQIYQAVLGLDFTVVVVSVAAIVVSYALLGGYLAVVVTDMVQVGAIVFGFLLLLVFCFFQVQQGGGFDALPALTSEFWHLSPTSDRLFLLLTFVLGWSIAPEMWQRMSSINDEKKALKTSLLATFIILLMFSLIIAVGIFSKGLLIKGDSVLVDLAFALPHPILTAVIIAAVTSAIASTMDSSINVGSLTLTHDLYRRYLNPQASPQKLLWVSRLSTALIVLPGIALAIQFQDIIRVLWISADIYTSMMFVPIVGLLYIKHPTKLAGLLAMGFGGACVLISALNQYDVITVAFWPQWPVSTALGVGLSALGFAMGQWVVPPSTGASNS